MKSNDIETQQIKDQFYIAKLIAKKIKGELNDDSKGQFEIWYNQSDDHKLQFKKLEEESTRLTYLRDFIKSEEHENSNWDKIVNRIATQSNEVSIVKYNRRYLGYVATLLLPLFLSGLIALIYYSEYHDSNDYTIDNIPFDREIVLTSSDGTKQILPIANHQYDTLIIGEEAYLCNNTLKYDKNNCNSVEEHTLEIPKGDNYRLTLSDGTVVYLNSNSSLHYPTRFTDSIRKVRLIGEAYFEVVSNVNQPFIVEVDGNVQVEVLGTSFGVRSYREESEILTTLVTGKVKINQENQELLLNPGWQASYNRTNNTFSKIKVDVSEFVGWKDNRLVFNNKSLQFILDRLQKVYDFNIFYQNDALKRDSIFNEHKKAKDFYQILNIIEQTEQVSFQIKDKTIIVKPSN